MRPRAIVFFLCLALVIGGVAVAGGQLHADRDRVGLTETVRAGDPAAAAAGLVVGQALQSGSYLQWQIAAPVGDPAAAETTFDNKKIPWRELVWPPEDRTASVTLKDLLCGPLEIDLSYWGGDLDRYLKENDRLAAIAPFLRAVAERTPSGETRTEQLRLADWMEEQPIEWRLDVYDEQVGYYDTVEAEERLDETFRFPIAANEVVEVSATRNEYGVLMDCTFSADLALLSGPMVLLTEPALWFTVVGQGELDFSEVPEGPGLYRLAVTAEGDQRSLDADSLKNCYTLPGDAWICGLMEGAAGDVLLTYEVGGAERCAVLDAATGALRQELSLPQPEGQHWTGLLVQDGTLLLCYEDLFYFYVWEGDGYVLRMTGQLPQVECRTEETQALDPTALAWDGERLALGQARTGSGWDLAVYDAAGTPCYVGTYATSLSESAFPFTPAGYYGPEYQEIDSDDARVVPLPAQDLTLRWEP